MNAIVQAPELADACELVIDPERPWLDLRLGAGATWPNIVVHAGLPPPTRATVQIGAHSNVTGTIIVWGERPRVVIGKGVSISGGQICCGNTAEIRIGDGLQCAGDPNINARHNGAVIVGSGNLWSNRVFIATDDMHAIRDLNTGTRINRRGGKIVIGDNVWLGYEVLVRNGAVIGDGAIIGERTRVACCVPARACAVGDRARVVREGVYWTHEDNA